MSSYGLMMRESFNTNDNIRDEGLTTPEGVERFDDICYGPDMKWNNLDVYRPAGGKDKLPVIISFHGGGWVYGDKERYQYYCMNLAKRGFAVINFTYRLAPEHKWPAAQEDMNLVAQWVIDNAQKYGLDTDHIFGIGDSAGANGIGLYASIVTNPEYAALYPFKTPEGFRFCAIGTLCGTYIVDLPNDKDEITLPLVQEYLCNGGTVVEMDMMNVTKHITGDYPPVFAASAAADFLKIQIPHVADALMNHNIPFEIRFYSSERRSLEHDFHCNVRIDESGECADDLCAFFRKYC